MTPELAAVNDALDRAAAVDARGLSADELLADLEASFTLEAKLKAVQSSRLVVAHEIEATTELCGRTTRSWLVEEQRLDPVEAGRRMRLARGLPDAPVVFAALAAGDLHAEHALVILPVLRHLPDAELRAAVEEALVELGRERPPGAVARKVDEVLAVLGADRGAAAADERRYGRRGVTVAETFGGTGSLAGTLTPEVREKLRLALDAAGQPAGAEDDRTRAQRWHDALGEVAAFYLAHAEDLSPVAGERPRLVVTMSYEMLCARLTELESEWATLGAGLPVAPATARRLACDAEIVPAVLGAKSEVLDLGRASSVFNLAIRRAAWLRQGGRCAFPKCRRPPVDCHHIVWWSLGGATSLDNAAWMCAYHHWLVHEGGWTMRADPDGGHTFRSRHGRQLSSDPPPRHPQAA